MTRFLKSSEALRNLSGVFAALVIGGTFLLAAAGPALASQASAQDGMNLSSKSIIVRVA